MSKNKKYQQEVKEFVQRAKRLQEKGYTILYVPKVEDIPNVSPNVNISEHFQGKRDGLECIGPIARNGSEMFTQPSSPIKMNAGGEGAMPWGVSNRLPLDIYKSSKSQPYTASGLRYLVDLTCGLGVRIMYRYVKNAGGEYKERFIPYEDAGIMLRERIRSLRNQIQAAEASDTGSNEEKDGSDISDHNILFPVHPSPGTTTRQAEVQEYRVKREASIEPDPLADFDESAVGTLDEELRLAIEDYKEWKKASVKIDKFIEENELDDHFQRCMTDSINCDIYFPTVGLNQGRKGSWDAEIINIGVIPAVIARFEKRDAAMNINHVYSSEVWRRNYTSGESEQDAIKFPLLGSRRSVMNKRSMVNQLRHIVEENAKVSPNARPLWFCAPAEYPSPESEYYPVPHWWSLYSSLVFLYASTFIFDKSIARQNGVMWGKIIYINHNYLQRMYAQNGIKDPKQMEEFRSHLIETINRFLRQRQNNGKTVALDAYVDPDMKGLMKSIEIVDVPQPKQGTASTEELDSIRGIIAWAMGIHSSLLGDSPGSSKGGTFQRELHLLKQTQMSPHQRSYIRFLNNIFRFNGWDPAHARAVIIMPKLTTLDNSKTGFVEEELS